MFRRRHQIPLWQRLRRWLWPHIGWRRTGAYLFKRVTRLSDTPHSIAAGVACGVAISFTPFIGFHLLGAFLLCLLVRGNYVAAAVGTLAGNPWTLPFMWLAAYKLGHALMGGRLAEMAPAQPGSLLSFAEVGAVFWPTVVGCLPLAVIGALATYFPLMRMIAAYQRERQRRRAGRRRSRIAIEAQGTSPDAGVP
ncbi:MAG: DUF2062 domain-containing protein [Geminicoccaceae bacterium]